MIYICIPVFNRVKYTVSCLQSIFGQNYKDFKVIICDDGSRDNTSEIIKQQYPQVIVLQGDGNLWWAGGTNRCIEYALKEAANTDYVFTLNNDTELLADTLTTLVEFAGNNPGSIVSCGNYFNTDHTKLEATAFVERKKWPFSLYHKLLFPWGQDISQLEKRIYEVDSLAGKGVLISVEVFKTVGLLNNQKLPQYHGDSEFTRRARNAGFRIFINLNAVIYTDQSASGIGQVNSKVSLREFIKSFFSLRSENHLKSLYYRAKLIYKRKWIFYLAANIVSIKIRFLKRYLKILPQRFSSARAKQNR